MTPEPGDVIMCGTSLGVLPMKPGTVVEVVIDGIGRLSNTFGGWPRPKRRALEALARSAIGINRRALARIHRAGQFLPQITGSFRAFEPPSVSIIASSL